MSPEGDEVKELTLQDLLERDKDKIAASRELKGRSYVDPEDELLAEFGLYFGWEAVMAVKTNIIDYTTMISLTLGARKVNNANRYTKIMDTYLAVAGSQSEKGSKALKQHLGELRKT